MYDLDLSLEELNVVSAVWQRKLTLTSSNRHLLSGRLSTWLDSLGLHCNPFDRKYLDAGADANLSSYLVGHTVLRSAGKQIAVVQKHSTEQRFLNVVTLVKQTLDFEGLYLLIEAINAYVESVTGGRRQLSDILAPLLTKTCAWSLEKFFPKYFLPADLVSGVRFSALLQPGTIIDLKLVSIEWTKESLNTILQERLRFARQWLFTNLDAICAPTLRNVQEQLLEVAAPLLREVLALVEQLLLTHVVRLDEPALLEPVDLEMAIAYHRHGSFQQAVAA